jgi:hypothetical protein
MQANQYKTTNVEEGRRSDRDWGWLILNNLRRQSRPFVSKSLWVLDALLCAPALAQNYWIGEVAQAERERARTNLTTALAELESDFYIELTRAFAAFELPDQGGLNYSERYKEWLRLAPYPSFPVFVWSPCVHAVATTPEGSIELIRSCSSVVDGLRLSREKSPPPLPAQRSLTSQPERSPSRHSDPLHRRLRQLRYLGHCFDWYRVERTSSRAGAEDQRLFRGAHERNDYGKRSASGSVRPPSRPLWPLCRSQEL